MADPHAVIPAPARFDAGREHGCALRPGSAVEYTAPGVAPIVERFCAEVARRTGLRLAPMSGAPGEPPVQVELGAGEELGVLPAPLGLAPAGDAHADERHSLVIDAGQVVVRSAEPVGVARALTTLTQLLATAPDRGAGEARLPAARILDAPRYAWRGLSLDVARTVITPGEVRRVIDLLALYKLNVLHLHLTDDEAWRLPVGRPARGAGPGAGYYSAGDLRALVGYAADRFVTIVPEVDTPGHAAALLRLRPELSSGRNEVDVEVPPGHPRRAVWLDPELPATFPLVEEVLAGVAEIFPGRYIHIGGDEPWGMPHGLYASYVPYAEPPADPAQADRQGRLGLRLYAPKTVEQSFGWEPAEALGAGRAAQVAGVEAAIWAETVTGFDDLAFLLLPRLPGIAGRAWSTPQAVGWAGHRDRLARHGRLWAQDGLSYFRSSAMDWR